MFMACHRYVTRLAVIPIFQVAMVSALLYLDSSPHRWLLNALAVAALLVPFIGYMAVVWDAPLFGKWSRILKAGVLTLASIFATVGGYTLLFVGGLRLRDFFGW